MGFRVLMLEKFAGVPVLEGFKMMRVVGLGIRETHAISVGASLEFIFIPEGIVLVRR